MKKSEMLLEMSQRGVGMELLLEKAKAEGRSLTPDEQRLFRKYNDEHGELVRQCDAATSDGDRAAAIRAGRRTQPGQIEDPNNPGCSVVPFESRSSDGPKYFRSKEAAYRAGMWAIAGFADPRNPIAVRARRYCGDHGIEHRAASESVLSGGGILVPDELSRAIIDLRDSYGLARKFCDIRPMISDHQVVPKVGAGVTIYPVGEGEAVTPSDKTWSGIELTAKKIAALCKFSSELADDAVINIADDLVRDAGRGFAQWEDTALIDGDGSGTYHGIRGLRPKFIDGTHTASVNEAGAGHDTFLELDLADLNATASLLPDYVYKLGTPRWYVSQSFKGSVIDRLLLGLGGITSATVEMGWKPAFMGFEVVTSAAMPSGATTDYSDQVVALFGDMALAVAMGTRRELTAKVLTELYAANDQLAVLVTERMDLNCHSLGDNTTAGPLVALVAAS